MNRTTRWLASTVLALALAGAGPAGEAAAPQPGDPAPAFSLPWASRDSIARVPLTLDALRARGPVVLAFYPADWSGGCTAEVCMIRDHFGGLGALGAQVVGISGDYVFSHHEWAKHHGLPFPLASDHTHEVAKSYGSFNPASGYNRRTVFVVDRGGRIAYADLAYSARDTVSFGKLRAALAALR